MLQGVIVQGFMWGFYEVILCPPCFSSKGVYHRAGDLLGEGRSGEGPNHMTKGYERSRCRNCTMSNVLGKGYPGGEV